MKERPILFKGDMVSTILDGRKTQTRRIIKNLDYVSSNIKTIKPHFLDDGLFGFFDEEKEYKCPYGQIGDRLWVRESLEKANGCCVGYPATGDWLPNTEWQWKRDKIPSIFMPRWASRITLEITDIRVERLQNITEQDAIAEGCRPYFDEKNPEYETAPNGNKHKVWPLKGPIDQFSELWQSINGSDSWDQNPWVWVVEFKKL